MFTMLTCVKLFKKKNNQKEAEQILPMQKMIENLVPCAWSLKTKNTITAKSSLALIQQTWLVVNL